MKILRVGDPHVKVSNLLESNSLMEFVLACAAHHKVDRIELLGDLFHTHAVLRLEVVQFWRFWLERLSNMFETVVLVGNHDVSGDHSSSGSALSVFTLINNGKLHIIEKPTRLGVYGYIPYIHDADSFVIAANGLISEGATIPVCHQTFDGSRFENGFYAPGGIDPGRINSNLIISGHIHAAQEFGKVWYPGTARWDSASDANQVKGIWFCTHDDEGKLLEKVLLETDHVCIPIYSYEWKEGSEAPVIPEGSRASVELVGSSEWISKQKIKLKGLCSIKTKITDKKLEVRKAGTNLQDFVANHFESKLKTKVLAYMKELNFV